MILLTGSSGFLGQVILAHLGKNNVKTLSRYGSDYQIHLNSKIVIFKESFKLVVHAAGKAHSVPKNEDEKHAFFDVNVTGTNNLLRGLETAPTLPKSFIFISSVAVYGLEKGNLINENAPLLATDPYGQSKIQAEKLIEDWCYKNNVICTILRLPIIAGKNPPGNLKTMINGIKGGYYFNIAGGEAKKSIVMADDVAKIIPVVADIGGIYNLTDQYHPTFFELSQLMAKQFGKRQPINIPNWVAILLAKVGDLAGAKAPINSTKLIKITSELTFDDSKAQHSIGWRPEVVLNKIIF
jgi:nucleoside-diphosphate-sugar epimerase